LWVGNNFVKAGIFLDFLGNFALFARFLGEMGWFFAFLWRRN
jgi:hypothetical protein